MTTHKIDVRRSLLGLGWRWSVTRTGRLFSAASGKAATEEEARHRAALAAAELMEQWGPVVAPADDDVLG